MNGADIRRAREAKGWSQDRLAQEAGVYQPDISRLENTPHLSVHTTTLERIAAALGLELVIRFIDPQEVAPVSAA